MRQTIGLYKDFWHLDSCGQGIARTMWRRMIKLSIYTSYGKRMKPFYFQGQRSNFKVSGPLQRFWHLDLYGHDIARTMQYLC